MIAPADIQRAKSRTDLIAADVPLRRAGRDAVGCCPFHTEKTPSFHLFSDGHFHCFGCGAHGDVIAFVMRQRNLDFGDAVREILALPPQPAKKASPAPRGRDADSDRDRAQDVCDILASCGPITNPSPQWLYLHLRGLAGIRQDALLAHPALYCHEVRKSLPALVAPITGSSDQVVAVQRIWLLPRVEFLEGETTPKDNRAPLRARKKTVGSMKDGAVRLRPAGKVLGLAEGVETALACMAVEKGIPVWAVCGVQRVTRVWIPPSVERLLIFGDRGRVGMQAAERAAAWWRSEGIDAEPVFPDPSVSDFNDHWLAMMGAAA